MQSEPNDRVQQRLDEHGTTLNRHGERLTEHDKRLNNLAHMIVGDSEKRYTGLLDRMAAVETVLESISRWKRDIRIGFFVILALLGIIGTGVWRPQFQAILSLLGGL